MPENENIIRLLAFIATLLIFLVWESLSPKKEKLSDYNLRCLNNLFLITVSSLLVRFCFPVLILAPIAINTQQTGWGILNLVAINDVIKIVISILIMDLIIYFQHVATHHIPLLWRIHRVHHSDRELNVTTGVRFHPIEIILSLFIKALTIILFGIPVTAVIAFELILNIAPMFNHANIDIPEKIDRWMRTFIVTPDMHRIHHSSNIDETNSNYGFFLPWWDRLFKTYKSQPSLSYQRMNIGLDNFKENETLWVHRLILQPFIDTKKIKEEPL